MLTVKTKQRLINALTRKSLADEMEAAISTPAPLSAKLKRALEVTMANKSAAMSLISAIETAGPNSMSVDARRRVVLMMASKIAGQEIIDNV